MRTFHVWLSRIQFGAGAVGASLGLYIGHYYEAFFVALIAIDGLASVLRDMKENKQPTN